MINENEIEEKIQEEIKNLQDSKSFYEKMEHQNSILQLKIHCPSNKYQTEIYLFIHLNDDFKIIPKNI